MKDTFKSVSDAFLLGKRRIIASVVDQLKHHAHIERKTQECLEFLGQYFQWMCCIYLSGEEAIS